MYSKTVMDHFKKPRNVGVIEDADGVGEVGNPLCGDMMTIYLKIKDDRINDIKFQTFGCGAAIAVSNIQNWNMYACSWDGTSITTYLNGVFLYASARTGPLNTADTGVLEIGRDDGLGRYLNGNISFCLMYNKALSTQEIRQNYQALRGRYGI